MCSPPAGVELVLRERPRGRAGAAAFVTVVGVLAEAVFFALVPLLYRASTRHLPHDVLRGLLPSLTARELAPRLENKRVRGEFGRKRSGIHDVDDGNASARFEYSKGLAVNLLLIGHQVYHTIRDHHVGGVVGDPNVEPAGFLERFRTPR